VLYTQVLYLTCYLISYSHLNITLCDVTFGYVSICLPGSDNRLLLHSSVHLWHSCIVAVRQSFFGNLFIDSSGCYWPKHNGWPISVAIAELVVMCCDVKLTEEDKEAQERLETSLKLRDTWRKASKSVVESMHGVSQCLVMSDSFLVFLCSWWLNFWCDGVLKVGTCISYSLFIIWFQ